jgi:hypothetical protein
MSNRQNTIGYRIIRINPRGQDAPTRIYTTERAAFAAAQRFGAKVGHPHNYTSERVTDMPMPGATDAAGWDAYRLAHGIAARR